MLARKIPTPSQYISKWPVAVATDAGTSKAGRKSTMRLRKMFVRSGLVASTMATDGVFIDPDGPHVGPEAIDEAIERLLLQFPDFVFKRYLKL